ncbi:hypothetical protein DASC09_019780 [Saccharomycopsis crataegensis]|uniref:Mediator of RNA polymerase II transcription subunit 11 n=1 Tax=Saccharomycopsis crataegensis TaxID=43959 RepID=A0AAV5QII4_9ASCO|nr:hypothetical protein DASC09_019780 [Saccharomycopsis crataegensis]
MSQQSALDFVEERLTNLTIIDEKLVALLQHVSSTLENVKQGRISELTASSSPVSSSSSDYMNHSTYEFQKSVTNFYQDLEFMSSRLRREIILMDKQTSFNQTNPNDVSLLPITIDKKASWVGDWKFTNQINEIKQLLNQDTNYPDKIDFSQRRPRKPDEKISPLSQISPKETNIEVHKSTNDVKNTTEPQTSIENSNAQIMSTNPQPTEVANKYPEPPQDDSSKPKIEKETNEVIEIDDHDDFEMVSYDSKKQSDNVNGEPIAIDEITSGESSPATKNEVIDLDNENDIL